MQHAALAASCEPQTHSETCRVRPTSATQSFLSVPFQDTAGVDIGSLCAVAVEPRYLSAKMLEQVRTMSTQIGEWINRLRVDAVPLFLEN